MARRTKVIGFSLPPETHRQLEEFIKTKHKTRSEFFREMINVYFESVVKSRAEDKEKVSLEESDLAKVLKSYWLLKSQTDLKIIIIGLAIIVDDQGKVLIGARKEKDPWVENLTWVFPGGRVESLDFEREIKKQAKEETGLETKVKTLVASRIHPDSGFKPIQIAALYFYCQPIGKRKIKPGGDLIQLKWVKPLEVFKYFSTSTCDEVTKFLATMEKGS